MNDARQPSDSEEVEIKLPQAPSAEDLQRVRDWLQTLRSIAQTAPAPRPFIVVTPVGLPRSAEVANWLADEGTAVVRRVSLPDWATASTALYVKSGNDERLRQAIGFERVWRAVTASLRAERWDLADEVALAQLKRTKYALRARLGSLSFRASQGGIPVRPDGQPVHLHAVHIPDPEALTDESRLLDAYLIMLRQ